MIGVKSAVAIAIAAGLIAIAAVRHVLDAGYLRHLSPGACFLVGLVATLGTALLGVGWRFGVPSQRAVGWMRGRVAIAASGSPRVELPAMVQRLAVVAGFAAIVLVALGNHAAARIAQLPDELSAPAPSEYCLPAPSAAGPVAAASPAAPGIEPPGCALVKRAYQLGYAKSLGACAPKAAPAPVLSPVTRREVCTRRQLDEPYLHYGFRRVAAALGAASSVDPIDAARDRVGEVRTHIDYLDGLLADIRHAIRGSPHAAHHVWINLPDPHPRALREWFVGGERCAQRFADLPLWPAWRPGDEMRMVEHVLGQLLFATRFGTTASCSDYTIHWDAAPDTCRRLASDPVGALGREGALGSIRAVLDRRARQLDVGALARALGRQPPVAPPSASAIASVSCFVVDVSAHGAPTGSMIAVDGDAISLREVRVGAVRTEGDGPIDVYVALAAMFAGSDGGPVLAASSAAPGAPSVEPVEVDGDDFLLMRLDPLSDGDPFRGAREPLRRPELVEVYPFELHLHRFIDGFRRRYLSQRGRL